LARINCGAPVNANQVITNTEGFAVAARFTSSRAKSRAGCRYWSRRKSRN